MIILILAALIALVARVDAAGHDDDEAIELAIRYADALTGIGSDPRRAPTLDAYDAVDDDEVDELDELGELDEGDEVDDDDTTAALRRDAREGNGDGDATVALRSDALGNSDDGSDYDDVAERPEFANDALLTIDTDRERDEDAEVFAGDPAAGIAAVVTEVDGDDDTEISEGDGVVAMLDAELDPGDAVAGGDAVVAAAPAGAAELYEQSLRHQRPSPWGRLDVGVSLRRRWSEPMHAPASRRDEVWLVATWRR